MIASEQLEWYEPYIESGVHWDRDLLTPNKYVKIKRGQGIETKV